jgi:hypothetical protein
MTLNACLRFPRRPVPSAQKIAKAQEVSVGYCVMDDLVLGIA